MPTSSSSRPSSQRTRKLVGISTKMYFTYAQTISYTKALQAELSRISGPTSSSDTTSNPLSAANVDIFFIPDFLSLAAVAELLRHSNTSDDSSTAPRIHYGAQDCHSESLGPFTGEVSPQVLAELGCTYIELGHAERRRLFGETDTTTAAKAAAVSKNGMVPLICIGELERSAHEGNKALEYAAEQCELQISAVLDAVNDDAEVVFAYEPVWAIGAKEPADAEYVVGVVGKLREIVGRKTREGQVRFLYGGSAQLGLMEKIGEVVDGLFLGRFAHEPEMAGRIILEVARA